jgi:nucleotide-binding universal stress UspA family protein
MKTLLAIINEPKKAESFIVYVTHLARDLHMSVHLKYIMETSNFMYGPPPVPGFTTIVQDQENTLLEEAKQTLGQYVREVIREISSGISIEYSAQLGLITDLVDEYTSDGRADMVIIEGQEHKSSWSQSASNIDIVNNSHCPVWIIPHGAVYDAYREIVYATDYKEEDIPTLKNLIGLTRKFSPSVTALHVTDSIDFEDKIMKTGFNEMLQERTDYQDISVKSLIEESNEDTAMLINEYALKVGADLLVVLKENRGFFERIFNPGSAKKIVKEAHLPVLIYKY